MGTGSDPRSNPFAGRPIPRSPALLPDGYLSPAEVLYYSSRPDFVGFALGGIIAAVFLSLVGGAAIAALAYSNGQDPSEFSFLYLLIGIAAAGSIGGRIALWWSTCYAITSTRVVVKQGYWTRRVIDIPHANVQSVLFEQGLVGRFLYYGTLQLSSASVAGIWGSSNRSRPGVINWVAVPFPVEVRALFERVKSPRL